MKSEQPAPLDDLLIEVANVSQAYRQAMGYGEPCHTLRRSLIGLCQEVVELSVPGGVAAVAEGGR